MPRSALLQRGPSSSQLTLPPTDSGCPPRAPASNTSSASTTPSRRSSPTRRVQPRLSRHANGCSQNYVACTGVPKPLARRLPDPRAALVKRQSTQLSCRGACLCASQAYHRAGHECTLRAAGRAAAAASRGHRGRLGYPAWCCHGAAEVGVPGDVRLPDERRRLRGARRHRARRVLCDQWNGANHA